MPEFEEHISQAKHNIDFLQILNSTTKDYYDWQVTVCFYSAVHLINAHLAKTCNLHYRKHSEVFNAISPYVISPAKLAEDEYSSFQSLYNLSRRSRYLINENRKDDRSDPFFTHEIHFKKSLKHLDVIIEFMKTRHGITIQDTSIKSDIINQTGIRNFTITKR